MKYILYKLSLFVALSIYLSSCMVKEKPYPLPPLVGGDSTRIGIVSVGEDYQDQVFYSMIEGVVHTSKFASWDINLTTDPTNSELRMNGGNLVLLYPTTATAFDQVTSISGFTSANWKYDDPSGLPGTSGLGYLENNPVIGKVVVVSRNNTLYKFILNNVTANSYTITLAKSITATSGDTLEISKNDEYNFSYLNMDDGLVFPEPKKREWDIVFTKFRHIYRAYNPDGSDFLYSVAGALLNPFNTQGASDSTKEFNYATFNLDTLAAEYIMVANRDVIGFNWKTVNINTGLYLVNPQRIFAIRDQNNRLWKLSFFGYDDEQGRPGTPQFRYEILK